MRLLGADSSKKYLIQPAELYSYGYDWGGVKAFYTRTGILLRQNEHFIPEQV